MHVTSHSVVWSGISFDELCKLRENWTLGNAVPVMTSAPEFFGEEKEKAGFLSPPYSIKCQQLYFAAGTY